MKRRGRTGRRGAAVLRADNEQDSPTGGGGVADGRHAAVGEQTDPIIRAGRSAVNDVVNASIPLMEYFSSAPLTKIHRHDQETDPQHQETGWKNKHALLVLSGVIYHSPFEDN